MPHLVWDTEHPPHDPPACADPLVWRLSMSLRDDHCRADSSGFCVSCREFSPCRLLNVAIEGLVLAVARGERYRLDNGVAPE